MWEGAVRGWLVGGLNLVVLELRGWLGIVEG